MVFFLNQKYQLVITVVFTAACIQGRVLLILE